MCVHLSLEGGTIGGGSDRSSDISVCGRLFFFFSSEVLFPAARGSSEVKRWFAMSCGKRMAVVVFRFFPRARLSYASIPPALRLAAVVVRLLDDGQLGVRVGHGEV